MPRRPTEPGEKAERENQALALGLALDEKRTERKLNKLDRQDRVDGALHWLIIIAIYFVGFLIALMLFAMVFSMLFPGCWLAPDQINSMKDFLFTGGVGAGLATLARSRLGLERENDDV